MKDDSTETYQPMLYTQVNKVSHSNEYLDVYFTTTNSQQTLGTATSTSCLDDVQDFECFDQEIHDTVSSQNDYYIDLLINYTDLPDEATALVVPNWTKDSRVVSHNTHLRELILRFSSLIAMRQFQQSLLGSSVRSKPLCQTVSAQDDSAISQSEHMSDDEITDPDLTLNLLRQKNESEIRAGSAKLNERRAFYFSGFADTSKSSLTVSSHSMVTVSQPQPISQIFGIGLSLEAAPFSLSQETQMVINKDHRPDKKNQSFRLDLASIVEGLDLRTTVMIKNIPNKYTQKMLLERIDAKHSGRYDFFYLPIDLKNNCNVGYAFINMSDPVFVVALYEDMHGQMWERFNSEKICELTYGRIQGKPALVDNFQSAVDLRKVKPAVFASRTASDNERKSIQNLYQSMQK